MNRGSWNQRGPGGRRGRPRGSGGMHNFVDDRFDDRDRGLPERSTGTGGPLMTDHLQLHELDLELALLKRKRELIEKQQNMLEEPPFGGPNRFNYEEPVRRFDRDRFGAGRPVGQMRQYSERGRGGGEGGGAGFKRPAERAEPWQEPKRARRRPPHAARTLDRPKYSDRAAPKDHSNFRPTKVNKKKTSTPNKLHTYPVLERKNLIDQASKSAEPRPCPPTEVYDSTKPMSAKVVGRLELALGHILKELRLEHGQKAPFLDTFQSTSFQRALKHNIRERIRTVMNGLVVGSCSEIIILYREKFPKETDVELLSKISNSNQRKPSLAIDIIRAANPKIYFELNFKRILHESLENMFKTLSENYAKPGNRRSNSDVYENLLSTFSNAKVVDENSENVNKSEVVQDGENATTENGGTAAQDGGVSNTENTEQSSEISGKVEDLDAKTIVINEKSQDVKSIHEETDNKVEDITDKEGENTEVAAAESTEIDVKTRKEAYEDTIISQMIDAEEFTPEHLKGIFYCRLIEKLIKRMLPTTLPKFKTIMANIIKFDPEFQSSRQYLMEQVLEMSKQNENKPSKPFNKQMYYVKIAGRPRLPPKDLMTEFLNLFSPVSIKKHKAANNILFVGFDEKQNFDNILAENGSKIGNMKLDIKVSERITKKPNNKPDANSSISNASKDDNTDVKSINSDGPLDESLDNQINDLLTTIRKEEEEKMEGNADNTYKLEESADSNKSTLKLDDSVGSNNEEVKDDSKNGNNVAAEEIQRNGNQNPTKDVIEIDDDGNTNGQNNEEIKDEVKELEEVKNDLNQRANTPTRSSSRLAATPRTVMTRRSSKLGQN